ncbi:hypothetical protein ACLF3G_02235 [Falsiroseomonas sp. HC035]|uniref:hypothetical protein n=1 Tax=Falsiroseomonas sp. HC035 TaxID=3390999 RepID=UPI003D31A667
MAEPAPGRSWWTTLPGILTGVAALLTAVTGLLAVLLPLLQGRAEPRGNTVVTPAVSPPRPARPAEVPVPTRPAIPTTPPPAPATAGVPVAIADASFEVLTVDSHARRGGLRDIRVTFRATAGATRLELARSNVRILTPGQVHQPVEGFALTTLPAGASRQFWVRFEIREPILNPILSLTDDMSAPRGEARMPIGPQVAARPDARADGPPPLVLGQVQDIAGAAFEVLDVQNDALHGDLREIRVTFRVTARETRIELARSNVRILTPGRIHTPIEGFALTNVPPGATRQLWARFEIPGPLLDPVLSLTDDMSAPRGEMGGAL